MWDAVPTVCQTQADIVHLPPKMQYAFQCYTLGRSNVELQLDYQFVNPVHLARIERRSVVGTFLSYVIISDLRNLAIMMAPMRTEGLL